MGCVKGTNRVNHVTLIAGLLVAATALTMGCPFDSSGTGSLVEQTVCSDGADCDDDNLCTIDTCEASVCHHANDDSGVPDDGQECTTDACVGGTASNTPSDQGTPCDNGTKVCNTTGGCVVCSGTFGCAPNDICFEEIACLICADGNKNGDESDIDCGGPDCDKCADKSACNGSEDCMSGRCDDIGVCASCTDGKQNGAETGVDCGGSGCGKCNGEPCSNAAECVSTFCADGVCCNAICSSACLTCNLADQTGTCDFLPAGSDDDNPSCSGPMTCDGSGSCVPH